MPESAQPRDERTELSADRARVLAYRAAAHDLEAPGTGAVVLGAGVQDYPPGRSACPSVLLRTGSLPGSTTTPVHSVRGAMHLHATGDLGLLMAALRRKLVWRAMSNPGIVLVDGEVVGIWRQRRTKAKLTLTAEPFAALASRQRKALAADAETIAQFAGADTVDLTFA